MRGFKKFARPLFSNIFVLIIAIIMAACSSSSEEKGKLSLELESLKMELLRRKIPLHKMKIY